MQVNMERDVKKRRLDEDKPDEEIAIDNELLEKSDAGKQDGAENAASASSNGSGAHEPTDATLRAAAVAAAAHYQSGYGDRAVEVDGTSGGSGSSGVVPAVNAANAYSSSAQDEQLLQQLRNSKNLSQDKEEGQVPLDSVIESRIDQDIDRPEVRSENWHRLRRDNHKEVERRRRENINKGIDDLAKIVPNCDKHKGQILKKAVEYITQLQGEAKKNREEYAYGEMLLKQTLSEFTTRNKALQTELEQAWREADHWKKRTAALEKGT